MRHNCEGPTTVTHDLDFVILLLEVEFDSLGDVRLILDDENSTLMARRLLTWQMAAR